FDFRRIPTRLIMESLQVICDREKVKADNEALWVIARQSDGSLRDSQSLLDQIITFADGKITLQKAIEVLGLTDRALLLETLGCLVERSPDHAMKVVEKLYFTGCDPKVFLQELIEEIRHLLILKMTGTEKSTVVDLPDSEIEHLRKLGNDLSEEDIHLLFDMALKGGQDFLRAQDPRLVLEMLLLRMSQAPRVERILTWGTSEATASAAATTSEAAKTTAAPARAQEPSKPKSWSERVATNPQAAVKSTVAPKINATRAPAEPPTEKSLPERWAMFVSKLRSKAPLLCAKLDHVAPLSISDTELVLGISKDKKFLYDQLMEPKFLKDVEAHIGEFWGAQLKLKCQAVESTGGTAVSPFDLVQKKAADKNQAIKKEVEDHPLIQQVQKTFKAQIKSIQPLKKGD
ncbi:MAG: hypothetical protein ABL958_10145, partial [Bdellovibrionia bacterium]